MNTINNMREIKFRCWNKDLRKKTKGLMDYDIAPCEACGENHYNNEFLMEYTGLKDQKSKEIYEGDIFIAEVENNKYKSIVTFKNGGFNVPVIDGKGDCIVLGNVYENPELIK